MRISQAIARLQQLEKKHGDVLVFFDCPHCNTSFTPDRVVAEAVHLTQEVVHLTQEKK